ncbi:sphingolipid long chain base-responsive protein pil1 [Diplodia corticola]|uniref:Sphingolipid long chain base-responsive protein pil1 n=1 Tax=Diplodia corticola TaxID=236234 RepID=A0A1J9RWB0_9PEZI|nr:sphingolipid long chain base-responsive protein pil1 [Diplodia corticola]OJD32663.1 sphingolipid long chain base-responsive protein pil1 [Diplodia corticola]
MAIFAYSAPPPPPYTNASSPPSTVRAPSRSRSLNPLPVRHRNRSLSIRSSKNKDGSGDSYASASKAAAPKHRFTMASLRGMQQPELSKRLYKLIKSENHAISAHETAGRERSSVAGQLSEWGEATGDDAVSDVSDKLGVLMAEMAEQEDMFAQNLEDYRGVLKQIRNTESSVQPSRDHKAKVADEIAKLKYKEPSNTKIVQLEQELVRAEAQSLVAEAQLTNITRQKFKEAYDIHLAAVIERAEKQAMLAKHARRVLNLLDDSPIVPGETHPTYGSESAGRDILNDAEDELRAWQPRYEPITSNATSLGSNAMPTTSSVGGGGIGIGSTASEYAAAGGEVQQSPVEGDVHPAYRSQVRSVSGSSAGGGERKQNPPYPISEAESSVAA